MYHRNNFCENRRTISKQLQLSNTLRRLWTEHVMWTRSFIISTAFNLGDLDYVSKRLMRNPSDFADVLMMYYGDKTAKQFMELLTEHLSIAAKLVNAAKAGDTATANEQRRLWYLNADNIALFLSKINPYWDNRAWQTFLYDHLKMTENEASQILTGQFDASISQYDAIAEEALKMADYMTSGIIRQFQI